MDQVNSVHFQFVEMKFGLGNGAHCFRKNSENLAKLQSKSSQTKKERLTEVYSSMLDETEDQNLRSWKCTIPIKK